MSQPSLRARLTDSNVVVAVVQEEDVAALEGGLHAPAAQLKRTVQAEVSGKLYEELQAARSFPTGGRARLA
jgi:hypothetical protein